MNSHSITGRRAAGDQPLSLIPAWVDGVLVPRDKLEVHHRGLRHKAVSVFVMRGDETLLQRRALGKYHTPGLWANTCCTHPAWQETALACAHRRLNEELGLTGTTPQFCGQVEYRADVGGGMTEHELVDIFRIEAAGEVPLRPDPDEVMDVRWVGFDDLLTEIDQSPKVFTPWLRIYLADHLDLIRGDSTEG